MKKILSVLLAVSIMATPLVSRVSFAEETLSQEAEKERSWFQKVLNETKKVGNAGWLSTKEIANRVAAWINEDIADLQRTLIIELQVLIVFAIAYAAKTYPRKFSKNQEAAMRKIFNEELEKHLNRGKSGVVQAN